MAAVTCKSLGQAQLLIALPEPVGGASGSTGDNRRTGADARLLFAGAPAAPPASVNAPRALRAEGRDAAGHLVRRTPPRHARRGSAGVRGHHRRRPAYHLLRDHGDRHGRLRLSGRRGGRLFVPFGGRQHQLVVAAARWIMGKQFSCCATRTSRKNGPS